MLVPAPTDLGYASPQLGPWVDAPTGTAPTLSLPDPTLGVTLALQPGWSLLPPAAGTLLLHVPDADRLATRPFSALQGVGGGGTSPITPGRLVLVLRLLPEVEARLEALQAAVPAVDGGTGAAGSARPVVRWFTWELTDAVPALDDLAAWWHPAVTGDAATKLAALGLRRDGTVLRSGPVSTNDLKRPGAAISGGGIGGGRESLLTPTTATNWVLRCFDHRGRPLDPGAVAAWWETLLADDALPDLRAPNGPSSAPFTVAVGPGRVVHLVDAHEGPVDGDVRQRVALTGLTGLDPTATTPTVLRATADAATVGFTAAPTAGADDVPVPRAALLPAGTYGDSVTLWPSTTTAPARDFARVAVLDVERHLVGVARTTTATDDVALAAATAQARASTRVEVGRTATTVDGAPWIATSIDRGTAAIAATLAAGADGTRRLVTPTLDRATAPLAATPPAVPVPLVGGLPQRLPAPTVVPITGWGTVDGSTARGQAVALVFDLDGVVAPGTWVRCWTTQLDHSTGLLRRGDGGGAQVADGTTALPVGRAIVVVPLLDGPTGGGPAQQEVAVAVADGLDTAEVERVRFDRPAPTGGTPVALGSAGTVVVCERGVVLGTGRLPLSGATLLELDDPAAETPTCRRVDASGAADGRLPVSAIGPALTADDRVRLTEPPWVVADEGDVTDGTTIAATVVRFARDGLTRLAEAGAPPPGGEKLEVVATARPAGTGVDATVASAPLRADLHETFPPQAGHPLAPAREEHSGTAVRLGGPVAHDAAVVARDRTAGSTPELVAAVVGSPLGARPDAAAGATGWAAVLETTAFGVAAEPGLDDALASGYPTAETYAALRTWLAGQGITVPAAVDAVATEAVRALDRRIGAHARGAREAAASLDAAFRRAHDLVYVETPALDLLTSGGDGSRVPQLSPLVTLRDRLRTVPSLHVVLCIPEHAPRTWPRILARVRDRLVVEALQALREAAGEERFAAFHPSAGVARTLQLSSTTVVVDRAYLLTGSTHLWRRGLSSDSSVAVATFDDTLTAGRPASLSTTLDELLATRLGTDVSLLHRDPAGLVDAIRVLVTGGGGGRTAVGTTLLPDPVPSDGDVQLWDRDGAPGASLAPLADLTSLTTTAAAEIRDDLRPAP